MLRTRVAAVTTIILAVVLSNIALGIALGQSVDGFDPNAGGSSIYTLAVQADGKILVGGAFAQGTIGGVSRDNIARFDPNTGLVDAFNTDANPSRFPVYALAVQADGKILVGGQSGLLARLGSGTGLQDATFVVGTNGDVYALVVQADGKILAGGSFTFVAGGIQRNGIARYDGFGNLDSFNPNVSGSVNAMAVQADGKVLIGGFFASVSGVTRNFIARVNADGTLDGSFNPNANNRVDALAVQADGKILVGGSFTTIGGQPRNFLARLNADGTLDTAFTPNATAGVSAMTVQADGKILVGGDFLGIGGQSRTRLARLNADGTADISFNNMNVACGGAPCSVRALPVQADGKVLLGGFFTTVGGQPRNNIARLINSTAASQTLSATATTITWSRGGSSPEIGHATFELFNGGGYVSLGSATRVGTTGNWQLTGLSLPPGTLNLRARGYQMASGFYGDGSVYESVQSVAVANAPTVVTQAATGVTATGATLNASINPGGAATTAEFQYGTTTAYGNTAVITLAPNDGTGNQAVSATITGLAPNTLHHFRASATNSAATTNGGDFTFTTCPLITITPASLPASTTYTFYSQQLTASGGSNFTLSAGALPAGMTLTAGGLLSGTPTSAGTFNFTVQASDGNSCFGEQIYTLTITANTGLMFYPLDTPERLFDSRPGFVNCNGVSGNRVIQANTTAHFTPYSCFGGQGNFVALTGNITVVPYAPGYLSIYPGGPRPPVANSNFGANEITNNAFTVGLINRMFDVYTTATTEMIVDMTGVYAPPGAGGLYFHPLPSPVRLLETRTGLSGCFTPGTPLPGTYDPNSNPAVDLAVQGRSPIPSPCNSIPAAAQALVGNATSVFPNGGGYLTIYPSGGTRPLIASSNYAGSDVINGPFTVKLGADGKFKVYSYATTDLVIDILGYYSPEAMDANGPGLLFNPLPTPVRLLETRPDFPGFPLAGCFRPNAPINGNQVYTQPGRGTCTVPNTARALVGNATVVNPVAGGFLTFWPSDAPAQPTVATSNYTFPVTFGYNRHFIVGLGAGDGAFKMYSQFRTDLIVDVSGYFAP